MKVDDFGGVEVDGRGFNFDAYIDDDQHVRVLPASMYKDSSLKWRAGLGHYHSAFVFPTTELVEWLKEQIGDRKAIEICSGNGVLAKALGIPATDAYIHDRPEVKLAMQEMRQLQVRYGANVEKLWGEDAIQKYNPQVVIGSWVVHRHDERHPARGGSMYAVNERFVINNCETYIHIGNRFVHRFKEILDVRHKTFRPDWLYSRAFNGSPDEIRIWGK